MDKDQIPRLSLQGLKVLRAFVDAFEDNVRTGLAGADLMRLASVSSGTLYPLLLRFQKAEIIQGEWEDVAVDSLGRPRRRYYRLTPSGLEFAKRQLTATMPSFGLAPRFGS